MTDFRRGIRNPAFLDALGDLAAKDGWWREVVRDPSLIIGIRDEYLNVYWQGQSLFKVGFVHGAVTATTHPKYLLNPDLSGQVTFDIGAGAFAQLKENAILRAWEPGVTLGRMKRAASLFSGDEKIGVQAIASAHPDTIDVEIAFPATEETVRSVPRIDLAVIEDRGGEAHLVFWEAKLLANPELRSKGEKNVVRQIEAYRRIVDTFLGDILASYRTVAGNLATIAASSGGARVLGPGLAAVAAGAPLVLADPPEIGLLVYGYDAPQRDEIWKELEADLKDRLGPTSRVIGRGDAKSIRL